MKKWMFVIFPGILLLLFLFFYQQNTASMAERERIHAIQAAQQKADDAARKQMIEEKAHEDAEKRAADQVAEDAKKQADIEATKKAERDKIQAETDADNAQVATLSKQADDLQAKYDDLIKQEADENRLTFDLLKSVELARIAKQNAELESDRMVGMIAARADKSYMTQLPPPPPQPASSN